MAIFHNFLDMAGPPRLLQQAILLCWIRVHFSKREKGILFKGNLEKEGTILEA
jgi:hypothetical protein